jgi:hypothetical protein
VLYGPGETQVRGYLQDVVTDRYGADGWAAFLAAPTAIAVAALPGRWAASHEPSVNLLIRSPAGWTGRRRGGGEVTLAAAAADALDRLLASPALWAEPSPHPAIPCPDAGAGVVAVRHAGRIKTVYQSAGCGPANLSTQLIATALSEEQPR